MSSSIASSSRTQLDTRPVRIDVDPLPASDGSASFAFGDEAALASLSGPIEVRIRDELTDRATLEITHIPLDGPAGIASSSFGTALASLFASVLLLSQHPRSLIQLTLQSTSRPVDRTFPPDYLSNLTRPVSGFKRSTIRPTAPHPDAALSASEKAALINASMSAFISGGIAASATVLAVAVAVLPKHIVKALRRKSGADVPADDGSGDDDEPTIVIDPDPTEESYAKSTHCFAFALSGRRIDADQSEVKREDSAMQVDGDEEEEDDGTEARLVFAESAGPVDYPVYRAAIRLARREAKAVQRALRATLELKYLGSRES